jgi:hypothetical protein
MSYLAQYAGRRPASAARPRRGVRLDERTLLNYPEFDGGAYVRVFVEDTSGRKLRWRRHPPTPRIRLRIADCMNEIALEFSVESAELRANSVFKIDTLLAALHRFRDAFVAEADLYAQRSTTPTTHRKEDRCRT